MLISETSGYLRLASPLASSRWQAPGNWETLALNATCICLRNDSKVALWPLHTHAYEYTHPGMHSPIHKCTHLNMHTHLHKCTHMRKRESKLVPLQTGFGLGNVSVWPWAKNVVCGFLKLDNNKGTGKNHLWPLKSLPCCSGFSQKMYADFVSPNGAESVVAVGPRSCASDFSTSNFNFWKRDLLMLFSRFFSFQFISSPS